MRKAFIVYVDLDPVPGTMHTQESAQNVIRNILFQRMPAYNPTVSLAPKEFQPETTNRQVEAQKKTFTKRSEANYARHAVVNRIADHGYLTVADYHAEILKINPSLDEYNWGWDSVDNIFIIRFAGGHKLCMPQPKLLTP